MFKKLAGLTKRRTLTIYLLAAFVLLLGGGTFYYFKYYKIGADTLVKRNTSCVIKVTDSETKQPIKGVTASFNVFPENPISLSRENGCITLPSELADAPIGDYYQVNIYQPGYSEDLVHLPMTRDAIAGKSTKNSALYPTGQPVAVDGNGNKKPTVVGQPPTISNKIVQVAQAKGSRVIKLEVAAYDNLSKMTIDAATISLMRPSGNLGYKKIASCATTSSPPFYHCDLEVQESLIKYSSTKIYVEHPNYYERMDSLIDYDLTEYKPGQITIEIPIKPKLVEETIDKFTGKSNINSCQGTTGIQVSWYGTKSGFEKKLWNSNGIQAAADNLAAVICALGQNNPQLSYLPTPTIKILEYMDLEGAAGYVHMGQSVINIANEHLCGGIDPRKMAACQADKEWHFDLIIHEYGHILDLGNTDSQYMDGRYSTKSNFFGIFVLVNATDIDDHYNSNSHFVNCPKTATIDDHYNNKGQRCYFTKNEMELWAESFTLWMGQSLASDLKLDISKIKADTIPIDEYVLTTQALNVFKFWKKFMATTLGSYCHPSIVDDNGRKTGLTYSPPFDLPSAANSTFTAGGLLKGIYMPDDILAGKATSGPDLQATFKTLPKDYKASGLTVGVSMKCSVSAGGSTRSCFYGPYSISLKDTDMVGVTSNKVLMMPQAGMSKYDIVATYKCPNGTEGSQTLEGGLELNTQQQNKSVTIDFTKFPSCSSSTTPGQPTGTPNTSQPPTGSPMGPGMPGAQ